MTARGAWQTAEVDDEELLAMAESTLTEIKEKAGRGRGQAQAVAGRPVERGAQARLALVIPE
jgi:hypothetical protein